jgi:hypothetical protein
LRYLVDFLGVLRINDLGQLIAVAGFLMVVVLMMPLQFFFYIHHLVLT